MQRHTLKKERKREKKKGGGGRGGDTIFTARFRANWF